MNTITLDRPLDALGFLQGGSHGLLAPDGPHACLAGSKHHRTAGIGIGGDAEQVKTLMGQHILVAQVTLGLRKFLEKGGETVGVAVAHRLEPNPLDLLPGAPVGSGLATKGVFLEQPRDSTKADDSEIH